MVPFIRTRHGRRRSSIGAAVVACGLLTALLGACGGDGEEADEPTTTASEGATETTAAAEEELDLSGVTLRVGVLATTSGANLAIIEESGAFEGTPYEIEWVEFENSNATVEALNAGAVDFGASLQSTTLVLAMGNASEPWTAETAPFTVLAAEYRPNNRGFGLTARADSGIESVEDLVGRKVSYSRGSSGHYFLVLLATEAGIDLAEIEEVPLTPSEGRAAFLGGSIDAIVFNYATSVEMEKAGEGVVLGYAGDHYRSYNMHVVRAGLLDDPAAEAAIADLLERIEAWSGWIDENLDRVAEIYATVGNLDPEDAALTADAYARTLVPVDDAFVEQLVSEADVFRAAGVITNEVDPTLVIDRRFDEDSDG